MFTSRLWAAYGVTCLLTLVVRALVLHDLIGAILAGFQTVPYLFTCFVGLTLLSFVPRPPLRNPASQVAVFVVFSALSGLTAAAAGAALLPLLGQSAEFDLHPAYYLDSLPVLGPTFIAIAFIHLTRHPHRRREHHQTSHLTDRAFTVGLTDHRGVSSLRREPSPGGAHSAAPISSSVRPSSKARVHPFMAAGAGRCGLAGERPPSEGVTRRTLPVRMPRKQRGSRWSHS